jgi:hypothetical protein
MSGYATSGDGCRCGEIWPGYLMWGVELSYRVHDLPEVRIRVQPHDVYRCSPRDEHISNRFLEQYGLTS